VAKKTGGPIRFVQIEPGEIIRDPEFRSWNSRLRGLCLNLALELCAAGGQLPWDTGLLAATLRYKSPESFLKEFQKIKHRFKVSRGCVTSPEVTDVLARARKFRREKQIAGKRGAQNRWGTPSRGLAPLWPGDSTPTTKESETKRVEEKPRHRKSSEDSNTTSATTPTPRDSGSAPDLPRIRPVCDALQISEALSRMLPWPSKSDRTCLNNVSLWLAETGQERGDIDALMHRISGLAREAVSCRNPAAAFMAAIKSELGYQPPSRKSYSQELKARLASREQKRE